MLSNIFRYLARVGELDLYDDNDGARPIDILIKEVKLHEKYSATQFTSDIAILILSRSTENLGKLNKHVFIKERSNYQNMCAFFCIFALHFFPTYIFIPSVAKGYPVSFPR